MRSRPVYHPTPIRIFSEDDFFKDVKRYDGGKKDLVDAEELSKILERRNTVTIEKDSGLTDF